MNTCIYIPNTKNVFPVHPITTEDLLTLTRVSLASQVDLYTTWGKVWQCGGAGQCGTCVVEVKRYDRVLMINMRSSASAAHLWKCIKVPTLTATRVGLLKLPCTKYVHSQPQVLEGAELLSARNNTEKKKLGNVS